MATEDHRARWHVGKEIPLALIGGVILQTVVFVSWVSAWSSKVDAKLDRALDTLQEFRSERYTREDARRDLELMRSRDVEHDRRMEAVERRLDVVERQIRR